MKFIIKPIVLILLFVVSNIIVNAQCTYTIGGLPNTMNICKNGTLQLNPFVNGATGLTLIDTFWTPTTGLSDPNIINPVATYGTGSIQYTVTVQGVNSTNLATNGNFEAGNTGFSTNYILGFGGSFGTVSYPGTYTIVPIAHDAHVNFETFPDHTTGFGLMMICNGDTLFPYTPVWCQTIAVTPNTWYYFSAWGASCVTGPPAVLQYTVNGVPVGTATSMSFSPPNLGGTWENFTYKWFSGANTTADVCIIDTSSVNAYNDFALDDISIRQVCNVSDSVQLNVINLTPAISAIKHLGCSQDTVNFSALTGAGTTPTNWQWTFGDGNFSNIQNPQHIYPVQDIYQIKLVTSAGGCKDSVTTSVNLVHPLKAKFWLPDSTCVNQTLNIVDSSQTSGPMIINWVWGDGTSSFSPIHQYTKGGIYTIKLYLQDNVGCKDSFSRKVIVLDEPYVHFTVSDSDICLGDIVLFKDTVGTSTANFKWDFGDNVFLNNVHNPSHNWVNNATYTVILTGYNAKCPNNADTIEIKNNAYPIINLGKDTFICPSITSAISIDLTSATLNSASNFTYNSNTNISTINTISIVEPGNYWVTATNNNCSNSDTIKVTNDCYLNIPNSFSPNGDGINDYFLPRELLSSGVTSFKMELFNRWGENIFSTTNLNGRGWDGKYGLKDQPLGVYVYMIDVVFRNGDKKSYTGNVTLIR